MAEGSDLVGLKIEIPEVISREVDGKIRNVYRIKVYQYGELICEIFRRKSEIVTLNESLQAQYLQTKDRL